MSMCFYGIKHLTFFCVCVCVCDKFVQNKTKTHKYEKKNSKTKKRGLNTIVLYLRISYFFVLSHKLGPMIRMIANMMADISTFMQIMGIIFIGFM